MAPLKTVRIRNASSQWFDRDVVDTLSIRDKLFKFSSKPSQHRLGNLQGGNETFKRNRRYNCYIQTKQTLKQR